MLQRNRLSANFRDGRQLAECQRAFSATAHHPLGPVQLTLTDVSLRRSKPSAIELIASAIVKPSVNWQLSGVEDE